MEPLRFAPLLKHALWGGRRLGSVLGKALGPESDYAESWEICDHGADQSLVLAGPFAGWTLSRLVQERGPELFGRQAVPNRFPLLLKFLDAQKNLSVQVHPNDAQAAQLDPPDLGKTECWLILAADPGSKVYAGLQPGVDRETFAKAVSEGTCEACLAWFHPRPGDCVFLPAGIVHALGAGLVLAELQESSDVTYRVFDWNRVGSDGRPRRLHLEQSLQVIDFTSGPVRPRAPRPTDRPDVVELVRCDYFVWERWQATAPSLWGGDDCCRIVTVVQGSVRVAGDPVAAPLRTGDSLLLPAAAGAVRLTPDEPSVVLVAGLPA